MKKNYLDRKPRIEEIANALNRSKFKVFKKPYDCNFGGIRTKDLHANSFNDYLYIFYYDSKGNVTGEVVEATTDSGLYYRINPMNKKGTAVIKDNEQHLRVYALEDPKMFRHHKGHKGRKAFRQKRKMLYWRDNNGDGKIDRVGKVYEEIANTNVHYMGRLGNNVDKWSAGCPGATEDNMQKLFRIADKQVQMLGSNTFSFCLFDEEYYLKTLGHG